MLVGERMSHPVITAYPETSLEEALGRMRKEHIHRLPIVNRRGELVGIISERDIFRALPSEATTLSVWEQQEAVHKLTVQRYMIQEVITVDEDAPIEEAACLMVDNHVSGLPVTREGRMTGIITETDLFKVFLELLGAREPGVRLTALIPKEPGQLMKLSKAVYDLGGDILALGTFMGEDTQSGEITLKVAGVGQDALAEGVRAHVERIKDVRTTVSC